MKNNSNENELSDFSQFPIHFLPSLKKKTVIALYHVVIWALILSVVITVTGIKTYDQIKIIQWITIIAGALLFPLFMNSHPPELPEGEMRRATISMVVSFGILIMMTFIILFLKAL